MENRKINLVKICVGAKAVKDLWFWQKEKMSNSQDSKIVHVTRMRPQRETELLNGGSIYWVFKGSILARQQILYLTKILGQDGITRCGLVLNPEIYLTYPVKKRPFQGWRYLKEEDAPKDYEKFAPGNDVIPTSLKVALSELGII